MLRFGNMSATLRVILIVVLFTGLTPISRAQGLTSNLEDLLKTSNFNRKLQKLISNASPSSNASLTAFIRQLLNNQQAVSSILSKEPKPSKGISGFLGQGSLNIPQMFSGLSSAKNECMSDLNLVWSGINKTEMWAMKMVDAAGKPGPGLLQGAMEWVGNYDECLSVEHTVNEPSTSAHVIKGNYCRLTLTLPSIIMAKLGGFIANIPGFTPAIKWHVCVPSSCGEKDVAATINKLPLQMLNITLKQAVCLVPKEIGKDSRAIAALIVLSLIAALSLVGTGYDIMTIVRKSQKYFFKLTNSENRGHVGPALTLENGDNSLSAGSENSEMNEMKRIPEAPEPADKESLGRKVLLAFSILKNTEKIFTTRTMGGNLGCLHGIRVLSISWIVLSHLFAWGNLGIQNAQNIQDLFKLLQTFTFQAVVNAPLSVDSFFLMSGCLVAYLFIRETKKTGKITCRQMVLYYVHRYWRLTPIYMITLMFYTCLMFYLSDGPFDSPKPESQSCYTNWWINFLYINNLYRQENPCLSWSWFLANDMQFYVVAPLALVPLALGRGIPLTLDKVIKWYYGKKFHLHRLDNRYMIEVYERPYCRIGVFAIGMALGYLLCKTNCKIKISRFIQIVGWLIAIGLALTCTYITRTNFEEGKLQWSRTEIAVYGTLCRLGWAIALSWIMISCITGHGGIVNTILSWKAWIPLGRLSYGVYLVHPLVQFVVYKHSRVLSHLDIFSVSYQFMGDLMLSFAAAYVLSVLVEAPCLGLEKAVLKK